MQRELGGGKGKEAFEGCERVRGGCGLSKTTVLWSDCYVILGVEISIFNKSLCTWLLHFTNFHIKVSILRFF